MIRYRYTKEKIFIIQIEGTLQIKDLDEFLDKFKLNPELPKEISIMYDLRDCTIGFDISEMDKVLEIADRALKSFDTIKTAILVKGSVETAYSMILKKISDQENRIREVFTTYDAAYDWLLKNLSY